MLTRALLLALGTALMPFASSTWSLIVVIGIIAGAGASTSGPAQLASAIARWIPEAKRSMANGIIGAGGSLGQFILVPLAQPFIGVAGWQPALIIVGAIGLINMFGSLWIGRHIQMRRMKMALAGVYFARALIILIFFFSPKVPAVFFLFAAAIGFTYLSTVPPTIGLVAKLHGARYMATLFGIVMLSHQIGGFLGAWLGGKAFEATGNYDWMWWADIALCLAAAAVHLPIREARPQAVPAAA